MADTGTRLKEARKRAGFKTAKDAAESLGIKYVTYSSHENSQSGGRGVPRDAALQYSRRFGVSLEWLLTGKEQSTQTRQVPLKGKIGAGQTIIPFDGDCPLSYVDAPPDAAAGTVAVEVDGDSMLPAYESGDLLFYSTHTQPHEMIGRRCVAKLVDGRILIKIIRRGSTDGLWTLQSMNIGTSDIEDQAIEWVAKIDWVKPR